MVDRRLPLRPDTYAAHLARRDLAVEQRLDMIGRPQSQRYFNPPCCADSGWTLTVEPGTVHSGSAASYTVPGAATAVVMRAAGSAPGPGDGGFGLVIQMTRNSTPVQSCFLTNADDTDSHVIAEPFAAGDAIAFAVAVDGDGTGTDVTCSVEFDAGGPDDSTTWFAPG